MLSHLDCALSKKGPKFLHLKVPRENEEVGVGRPASGVDLSGHDGGLQLGRHQLEVFDADENVPIDGDQEFQLELVLSKKL